jgi:TLD
VLRDEYAEDFGFDYSQHNVTMESILSGNDENQGNTFAILGTGVNDTSAQPHVLSPPLMDALMSIIGTAPGSAQNLRGQNYWLRYSLIRDGASIQTLKQYVRAAKYTIVAIETRSGHVFGSFTSSPWRNALSFYGGQPAFVWKMRRSRRTKCASLFDQAQLESEIDVYMCAHADSLCQLCRYDSLAIGGDDGGAGAGGLQNDGDDDHFPIPAAMEDLAQGGFAFFLEEDLMCGTTSPCATFTSPALYGKGDKSNAFDVAGLEIWSFTPCHDVKSAEKLEMTQFFIEESTRGSHYSPSTSSSRQSSILGPSSDSSMFTSRDLIQEDFYRRVGEDLEGDERRQRWQYANMMHPTGTGGGAGRGLGATPRFGYQAD